MVQTELYPIVGEPSVGREIFAGNHFSQVKCLGACHNMRRAERDARNGVGKGPLDRTEDRPFEIAFGPVDNCNAGYGGGLKPLSQRDDGLNRVDERLIPRDHREDRNLLFEQNLSVVSIHDRLAADPASLH